jgi:hypothetical protein
VISSVVKPRTTDLAVRGLGALLVVASGFLGFLGPLSTVAGLIAVAVINLKHVFCLKNYFLAYVMLLFGVGGQHFATGNVTLSLDLISYVLIFLLGYELAARASDNSRWQPEPQVAEGSAADRDVAQRLLIAVLGGWTVLLAGQLLVYGVGDFYGGTSLADRIARYGRPDFVNGLLTAAEQGLSMVTVAVAVYYIHRCVMRQSTPNFVLLSLVFMVVPIALLRRADNAIGTLFLVATQPAASRLVGARYSLIRTVPFVIASLLLSFGSSIVIGSLRETSRPLPPPTPPAVTASAAPSIEGPVVVVVPSSPQPLPPLLTPERTDRLIYSELSPIIAYRDIRENPADFGYSFGATILPPLALKIIPRSWLPDKPISSSAFYMNRRDPSALASGYVLPVTIFGDALLNFGYAGCLAVAMIIGLVAGRLDRVLTHRMARDFPIFLIIFYYFYVILRNDLANSLASVMLTVLVYIGLCRLRGAMSALGRVVLAPHQN